MKKLAHCLFTVGIALMMMTHSTFAQTLSPELVGLPPEVFNAAENVVFTQRTVNFVEIVPVTRTTTKNGVTTVTKSHTIRINPKTSIKPNTPQALAGAYGLNLVHAYQNEYGCKFIGSNDSALVFQNSRQEAYLVRNGNKAVFHVVSHPEQYVSIENQKHVFHSRAKVDSLSKVVFKYGILELERRCAMKFYGELKDPSTHITSIFAYATINGNVVENKSLINGKLWSTVNVGSLITSYGKKGVGYKYHWRYLNECSVGTTVESNSQAIGNMGQCGQSGYFSHLDAKAKTTTISDGVPFAYNSVTNTATMDSSKKRVVIIYMGGEVVSGKEESNQAYLDLDTGICTTFAQ